QSAHRSAERSAKDLAEQPLLVQIGGQLREIVRILILPRATPALEVRDVDAVLLRLLLQELAELAALLRRHIAERLLRRLLERRPRQVRHGVAVVLQGLLDRIALRWIALLVAVDEVLPRVGLPAAEQTLENFHCSLSSWHGVTDGPSPP